MKRILAIIILTFVVLSIATVTVAQLSNNSTNTKIDFTQSRIDSKLNKLVK